MVELQNVTRIYSRETGGVRALDDVSLRLGFGDFAAITGPSGCGKSTLLNILGGLDQPDSGVVRVNGIDLAKADEAMLTRYRRHTLGIVFQFFNLLPAMTVRENAELPLLLRGEKAKTASNRVSEMLDLVGLTPRAEHFPHQLSGGEMQRAAIARALVHRPALLVADEPTGNLDSDNGTRVLDLLAELNRDLGITILMATHAHDVAARATRVLRMKDGRFMDTGDAAV